MFYSQPAHSEDMRRTVGGASSSWDVPADRDPAKYIGLLYSQKPVSDEWLFVFPRARDPRGYVSAAYSPGVSLAESQTDAREALNTDNEQRAFTELYGAEAPPLKKRRSQSFAYGGVWRALEPRHGIRTGAEVHLTENDRVLGDRGVHQLKGGEVISVFWDPDEDEEKVDKSARSWWWERESRT